MVQVDPAGDLKVDIRGTAWILNPKNVSIVEGDGVPLTPGTSGEYPGHYPIRNCSCTKFN